MPDDLGNVVNRAELLWSVVKPMKMIVLAEALWNMEY